jgi:hypothetical protein
MPKVTLNMDELRVDAFVVATGVKLTECAVLADLSVTTLCRTHTTICP